MAAALLLDDDTVRNWRKLFEQRGIEGLTSFDMGGSASFLSAAQEEALKIFVSTTLPRSTRHVGAWIEKKYGLVYESRSGLIALLHRLGLEYHKPNVIPRQLDEKKQGLEIDGAVNVDALTPARLLNRELVLFGRPAADRPRRMGRMHRVGEQHGLVGTQGIHQVFIARNESAGITLMRNAFHPQAGPLTNKDLVTAEREAEMHLFSGVGIRIARA